MRLPLLTVTENVTVINPLSNYHEGPFAKPILGLIEALATSGKITVRPEIISGPVSGNLEFQNTV